MTINFLQALKRLRTMTLTFSLPISINLFSTVEKHSKVENNYYTIISVKDGEEAARVAELLQCPQESITETEENNTLTQ